MADEVEQKEEISYKDIHEVLLKSGNPFRESIVENSRQEIVDVESINAELTEVILESIERIRKKEKRTDLILIQGEPGLGKTHFLSRMRKKAKQYNYLFIDLPPLGDLSRIYSHIAQQLFINLNWKAPNDRFSPLFELIAHILSGLLIEILSKNKEKMTEQSRYTIMKLQEELTQIFPYLKALDQQKDVRNRILERSILILMDRNPELDQLFLEVLFKLIDPNMEFLALKWLKGYELSEEDLKRLNVRESISNDEMANRVLNSLLMITDRPILFCLDQLESFSVRFEAENGIKILFDTLTNMYNRYQNLCMLLMCQSHVWTEIEKTVERSALDRIQIKRSLAKLSFEEGILLVESRLKLIYPLNLKLPYSTYPFSHEFIQYVLKETGYNPRMLLNRISREYDQFQVRQMINELQPPVEEIQAAPPEIPIKVESLQDFLEKELEKIRIDIENDQQGMYTYPVRQDFTRGILNELFKEVINRQIELNGFKIIEIQINQKKSKKNIDITLNLVKEVRSFRIGIEINNSENMTSLYYTLRRLLDDIQHAKIDQVFLLRDMELPISPTAKRANELLRELERYGALIPISKEDTLELLSIKKLLEKAGSGDLMQDDITIARNDVLSFILPARMLIITSVNRIFEMGETITAGADQTVKLPSSMESVVLHKASTINSGDQSLKSSDETSSTLPLSPAKPSKSHIQRSADLEELFENLQEISFPQSTPLAPTEESQIEKEEPAPIQEINLKGHILTILRKQQFYTLKKLEATLPGSDILQLRELLYNMAQEQMITIIHDKDDTFLFALHPKLI